MALSDATTMARPPADMLRALRSSLLSLLAELLTDSLTTTKLMLVTQALVRSTDIAHIAELFATVRARAPAKAALQCRLAAHILPSGAGACIAVAPQVCGVVGLRDDEAAIGAVATAMPADLFYRLLQHTDERVRVLWLAAARKRNGGRLDTRADLAFGGAVVDRRKPASTS